MKSASSRLGASSTTEGPRGTAGRTVHPPALPLAALGYLSAAVLMTLRTWADPAHTSIGGLGDPQKFMGFLGWFPFAVTHGHNPLHMSWINLPQGSNAMWDTTMPVAALAIWPIRAVFGIVVAYNVLMVTALTLDGLCTFVWLRRHTTRLLAAFIGGLVMVCGPYAAARSYGHLNLLLFFPLPLILLLLEDIIREPRAWRVRRGLCLGMLAAGQLLLTEEPLALLAPTLVIALAVACLLTPHQVRQRAAAMVPTGLCAIAALVVVGGIPLAYQFFGPSVVRGAVQPHDFYVNDLVNVVVPTATSALSLGGPGLISGPTVPWTGNPIEWNGYIGVPLLLVTLYCLVRWRRDRWLLVVGLTLLATLVLSLGPHLHVNGVDHTRWPLPYAVIDHLPVFENIVPNRFGLLTDLGLAAILAAFVDRVVLGPVRRREAVVGSMVTGLVAASFWPSLVLSQAVNVPRYFQPGGDASKMPFATAALVFPIPFVGPPSTAEPAMWQAMDDFRFKMFSGASISVDSTGHPTFGSQAQPLRCVSEALQVSGSVAACAATQSAILKQMQVIGIRLVIVAPCPHQQEVTAYMTELTRVQPVSDQGVLVWPVPG